VLRLGRSADGLVGCGAAEPPSAVVGGAGGASAPHTPRRSSLRHGPGARSRRLGGISGSALGVSGRGSRGRLALVVGVLVLLVSGCRMTVDVNVTVEEDGSGAVEVVLGLDEDALEQVGGDLSAVLATDDLLAGGWAIDGPVAEADGFTRVRVSKPFGTPEEAAAVFAEVAGEDGPFQDFAVTRETSLAETTWGFTGRIDFSGGLEAFGDEGLAAELEGEPLGESVEEIEARLGESLNRLISVRVSVRLPGDVSSNATTKADNGAVWQAAFGQDPIEMEATGTERRVLTWVLGGLAVVLLIAAIGVAVFRLARRTTEQDRLAPAHAARPDRDPTPPADPPAAEDAPDPAPDDDPESRQ